MRLILVILFGVVILTLISFALYFGVMSLLKGNFGAGFFVFCLALGLAMLLYNNLSDKLETQKHEIVETIESDNEVATDSIKPNIYIIAVTAFWILGFVILIYRPKLQLIRADEKLHKFCIENHVSLDYKVETDIIRMTNEGVVLYESLIHDISRYKTFSALKTANTDSPKWMIWFFYVAQNNMVALNKDEMKSVAINYMSDLVTLYKKYKDKYGVVDALNKLNEACWLDLTSDDIKRIKDIVEYYKNNKDIKSKCRIPFKTNSAELIK